ncbi:hypothetical protein [Metamycoplasma hominis]|uniref:hypothetical protein n=1 Tax=Metamycoplasma hominis TaxID=2098 RepID=UPI003CF238E4
MSLLQKPKKPVEKILDLIKSLSNLDTNKNFWVFFILANQIVFSSGSIFALLGLSLYAIFIPLQILFKPFTADVSKYVLRPVNFLIPDFKGFIL